MTRSLHPSFQVAYCPPVTGSLGFLVTSSVSRRGGDRGHWGVTGVGVRSWSHLSNTPFLGSRVHFGDKCQCP